MIVYHPDQVVEAPAHYAEVGGIRGPHLTGPRRLVPVLLASAWSCVGSQRNGTVLRRR